jgi:hypothetical protein
VKTATPRLLFAAPLALLLAACGDKAANDAAPAATADKPAAAAADAPAKPKRDYPADYAINEAIPRGDIATRLRVVGEPIYLTKRDMVQLTVEVANNGKQPIVTAGDKPVSLAVNLVGPEGVDVAPGSRSFRRAKLPLIVEGTSAKVQVRVPAEDVDGIPLQLELVQEGVAWWGKYKQNPVDVGPFHRCEGENAGMCDAKNAPIRSK